MRVSSLLGSSRHLPSLGWAGLVVDSAEVYVERVCGPAHARWTVRIGERGAVVIEPESYLDGDRSDFPLRTVLSVRVDHEARHRHVVVFDRGDREVRLVCRDPAAAERVAARCRTTTTRQGPDGRRRSAGSR